MQEESNFDFVSVDNILPKAKGLTHFEKEVAQKFEAGLIRGPIHLSGGNERELIDIFENIKPEDYVFSTWRNHYHALLHGIPPEELMDKIVSGHSMNIEFPEHHFFTSSIVGGILPIATGVAAALKRKGSELKVWCFIGDMTSCTGMFHECQQYAQTHELPITFVIEDNGFSTDTPTAKAWGDNEFHRLNPKCGGNVIRYSYERTYPHCGVGKWVNF